jgi:L-ribulose-5-phosphate 3-epimerase
MNPIGIMQGRLSPPVDGRIQSFPVGTWRDEFARAREAGLACIEWIYETGTDVANPLGTDDGLREMRSLADETGVAVRSICADYYMAERLVDADGSIRNENVEHLGWLISRAKALGVSYMVLPFVDSSSVKTPAEIEGLLSVLKSVIPACAQARVELHLETDLPPSRIVSILQSVNDPSVRANYDIGNSASLGYDPVEELTLLGPWLGSVHVKDRILGGRTVPLGTGNADFPACFRLIGSSGFSGPFILQAAREDGLSETELAKRNRHFVETQVLAATSS